MGDLVKVSSSLGELRAWRGEPQPEGAFSGGPTPELEMATSQVKRVVVLELVGFFVIFTCMILMRFGL